MLRKMFILFVLSALFPQVGVSDSSPVPENPVAGDISMDREDRLGAVPFKWSAAEDTVGEEPSVYELRRFCRRTFRKKNQKRKCGDLPVTTVAGMKHILEQLKSPTVANLSNLFPAQDVKVSIKINRDPLEVSSLLFSTGGSTETGKPEGEMSGSAPFKWSSAEGASAEEPSVYGLWDFCRDIYSRRVQRKKCSDLPVTAVAGAKHILEQLKSPTVVNLSNLFPAILEVLIDIDIEPLQRALNDMSRPEKDLFLSYLAQKKDLVEQIAEEDSFNDFAFLQTLAGRSREISPGQQSIMTGRVTDKFAGGRNEEGISWIASYFENSVCEEEKEEDLCVFLNYYCRLNPKLMEGGGPITTTYTFKSTLDHVLNTHPDFTMGWREEETDLMFVFESYSPLCDYLLATK